MRILYSYFLYFRLSVLLQIRALDVIRSDSLYKPSLCMSMPLPNLKKINTFASQRLVFRKNKQFLLENTSNFLYYNLKKILRKNGSIFPRKRGAEKQKCLR